MSHVIGGQAELDRSRAFFEDPLSYGPLHLDQHLRVQLRCIDPRPEAGVHQLLTIAQTAGGAIGEGLDGALALSAMGEPTTIARAITRDRQERPGVVFGAHHNCAFNEGLPLILGEMATPSAFTRESVRGWARDYELEDVVTIGALQRVADAAAQVAEDVHDAAGIVEFVDAQYALEHNVTHMIGSSNGGIYVVNHHPLAGLRRSRAHVRRLDGQPPLVVQGYHDSLGVTEGLLRRSGINPHVLGSRVVALFLRAAAVRTVIGGAHEGMVYLEAAVTPKGFQVTEIAA